MDNCLEETQPAQTDHESARRVAGKTRRHRRPVRFSHMSPASTALCADTDNGARAAIVAADAFGNSSLVHKGWKHEQRSGSKSSSENLWD